MRRRKDEIPNKREKKELDVQAYITQVNDLIHDRYDHLSELEEGEELVEVEVFLANADESGKYDVKPGQKESVSRALNTSNPLRPKWLEAISLEVARLRSYGTWRRLSPSEEAAWKRGEIQCLPCALLLCSKRDGRYKARMVVLGNKYEFGSEVRKSLYAGVVSQTGNRAAMTYAARLGFEVMPFDITNAFLRAGIGNEKIAIRLPESMRNEEEAEQSSVNSGAVDQSSDNCENVSSASVDGGSSGIGVAESGGYDSGRRLLQRALYGLPQSPRLWFKQIGADMRRLQWEECAAEPGVWIRKDEKGVVCGVATIYVDDCIMCASSEPLCNQCVEEINKIHPLSRIATNKAEDGAISFDMLGADVHYHREKRQLLISMETYVDKVLKKFDMMECKPSETPNFEEAALYRDSKPSKFPYKECIGCLQWIVTVARPDLAHSVGVLARASARACTKSMERACRKVMKYLSGTKSVGVSYSPEQEREFNEENAKLADHHDNKGIVDPKQAKAPLATFTDASFGVAYQSYKSISGVIIYMFGTPVAWRSKRQTLVAASTTESEWVALADGIVLEQGPRALLDFFYGSKHADGPLFCDNRGAVVSGRKGLADVGEIAPKTRHVALRHAQVLHQKDRLWFIPTDKQKADGLTKSLNRDALKNIYCDSKQFPYVEGLEADEEFDAYLTYCI